VIGCDGRRPAGLAEELLQSDHSGRVAIVEVAAHRISHPGVKVFNAFCLRENRRLQSAGGKPAFRRLFHDKDNLLHSDQDRVNCMSILH